MKRGKKRGIRETRKMPKSLRFAGPGLLVLAVAFAAMRFFNLQQDSGWVDIVDTESDAVTATMTGAQVLASLEDVQSKYQNLLQSSNMSKKSLIANLEKLYQTAAQDYSNAMALEKSNGSSQAIDSLTQGASLLAESLYERKDSLGNYDEDFCQEQAAQSEQDLGAAAKEIEQAKQGLPK